jgi:hypothetical protein
MKQAAREAHSNIEQSKKKKQNELGGSNIHEFSGGRKSQGFSDLQDMVASRFRGNGFIWGC